MILQKEDFVLKKLFFKNDYYFQCDMVHCDMVHYPAGSSHQRMGTYMVAIKGWTWSEIMLR